MRGRQRPTPPCNASIGKGGQIERKLLAPLSVAHAAGVQASCIAKSIAPAASSHVSIQTTGDIYVDRAIDGAAALDAQ
jgi:hypothetical protein